MCGRIITSDNDLCGNCMKNDDREEFKIIREFLYANPGADINKIVSETKVKPSKVLQYIRDGRLDILKQ
jgi:hypothetical protein